MPVSAVVRECTQEHRGHKQPKGRVDPPGAIAEVPRIHQPQAEAEHDDTTDGNQDDTDSGQPEQKGNLGRRVATTGSLESDSRYHDPGNECQRPEECGRRARRRPRPAV